jgi:DNA relaxase NicK
VEQAEYPVLEAGVDWITVTSRNMEHRQHLRDRMAGFLADEQSAGNEKQVWRWKGYEGWHVGQATVGERADSLFCQLSGQTAGLGWLSLLERPVNVTRLDLQVTVSDVPLPMDLAERAWLALEHGSGKMGRSRSYSWINTRPSGSTLYVGAPSSASRLRLYDKAAESQGVYPLGTWRYEYQARSGVAGSVASGLADRGSSTISGRSTVHERFSASGIRPGFCASGSGVLGHVPRSRSDAQRKLRWLDAQVRPTLNWLRSNGYGRDAERALGLAVVSRE